MDIRGAGAGFRENNFDLLRIFAASQVMVSHAIAHLDIAPRGGGWPMTLLYAFPGVPIFFVISGFLISASYERSTSLGSYCRNRVLRIFPGLWCCILATVVVAACCGFGFMHRGAFVWLAAQLAGAIYTPAFLAHFGMGSYNGSLWTIPVELQFYIALPLVYWLLSAGRGWISGRLILVWAIFVAVGLAASGLAAVPGEGMAEPLPHKLLRYSFLPQFFLFMTGVVMQRYRLHEARWIAGKGLWWLAAYLACVCLMPASSVAHVPATLLLGVVAVSMAYTAPRTAQRWLRGNDISYGVYIYHGLLINLFLEWGLAGSARLLAWLIACTYLIGYLSWVMIERPFLRRKRQTISPTIAATAPPPDAVRAGAGLAET